MFKEAIKLLTDYYKAKHQYLEDTKRLESMELDMQALERLVNLVKVGEVPVKVTIPRSNGGAPIIIERSGNSGDNYKSFAEKFAEAQALKQAASFKN